MYNTLRLVLLITISSTLIISCASDAPKPPPIPKHPIQLRVHNESDKIIDAIDAKPCGFKAKYYKTQMTGIKPGQKIMLEIYQQCVDLVALDGFGTVLDELKYLRLNSHITWKIN